MSRCRSPSFATSATRRTASPAHTRTSSPNDGPHQLERTYPYRSFVRLSGKKLDVEGTRYYETKDGDWIRGRDVGVAFTARELAADGEERREVDRSVDP